MLQRPSALKANKTLQDLVKGLTQSHTRMQEGLDKTRHSSLTSSKAGSRESHVALGLYSVTLQGQGGMP